MIVLLMTNIAVNIGMPGITYDQSRFTWTGYITEVAYRGNTFCADGYSDASRKRWAIKKTVLVEGRGLCAEFSISDPPGFNECSVGGLFPKIGVGLLKRSDTNGYMAWKRYDVIKPFPVHYEQTSNAVTFYQDAIPCRGYAFTLRKRVTVRADGFVIDYALSNAGTRRIITEEYCHNFLAINSRASAEGCKITFPFPITVKGTLPDYLAVRWNSVHWKRPTEKNFGFEVVPWFGSLSSWTYSDERENVSLSEHVTPKPAHAALWGNEGQATCVELFIPVKADPGEVCTWLRSYKLAVTGNSGNRERKDAQ